MTRRPQPAAGAPQPAAGAPQPAAGAHTPAAGAAKPEAAPGPQLARLAVELLRPNPRQHPESQIERLMASLQRDGQTKPVLARRENHMIIAGHGLAEAARRLGLPELAVLLWDVDQATADRAMPAKVPPAPAGGMPAEGMLADNRLGALSTSDSRAVAGLLEDIAEADYLATGFTPDEVAKLLDSFDGQLEVIEVNTTSVRDDFWVTARGPLAQQAEVLQRLKTLLGEFPAVTVELGTVKGL